MKIKLIALAIITLLAQSICAQNIFKAIVKDGDTKEILVGVNAVLNKTANGASSDENGIITISNIPDGKQHITFSYLGYESETKSYTFPLSSSAPVEIFLEQDDEMLEEVTISSTRGTRTIQNIPTRVEFISSEELGEKGSMKPGDIRMLLNESTGIITQQTSATSGNASIRIQGLDGRYTQILKDGFPVFAGAASGLGLLQTPPLDLKQVEIIKGSTSTLYGGGAIAGLINLISKTPEEKRDLGLHLNGTSGKGLDVSAFYGQRFKKVGTTIFASYNRNWAYDPSNTGFTAIPQFDRYVFNPKLFLYFSENTQMSVGLNAMFEDRLGGDIEYIKGNGNDTHSYFEKNKTQRHSTQLTFEHKFGEKDRIDFKNSVTYFNRNIGVPTYTFEGTQVSTFSELTYTRTNQKTEWVAGLNLWTDKFDEKKLTDFQLRDYNQTTMGAFVQNNWEATKWLNLETGLRADYIPDYGAAILPRVSAHFKITDKFSSRLGGGFGYKSPTIFTEDSERLQYQNVLPIDKDNNKLERSYGLNLDFNYVTSIFDGNVTFSINQLFFYTYLDNPLLLQFTEDGLYRLNNISGNTDSKGGETNVKIGYKDFHLYLGYTYTDTRTKENGVKQENILTPKHRLNSILMYEVEDKWKIGLEAYYFSPQKLGDGQKGKQYVVYGFMIEKIWEMFSLYANFENFTDRRQTRFDTIYTGSISNPIFRDIYAPLDGFVMNAGVKLSF
ncbi:TonB-dependent receptor [Bacteroides ovatus]|jgi:outer membrane receptor for ferrienterochelin and colicins|uniref:TonB-dependent receptor n=1 Tax=Bacteroides ovatus TaxID=28116 RepID=UPI001897286D|nr:TonB-dependent receptor [Bacteroides ovatus]MDC2621669.1 TonB-dependent receptor [Bacteroides ovatus]MDC2635493.1 TonB-dependent receptor [Bacteroides ovatus]MDC2652483.1 TonB-dependent receptor [Bacteroides ovatus]